MNYTKPEVEVLGSATEVIELIQGKPYAGVSDAPFGTRSAYDLDE